MDDTTTVKVNLDLYLTDEDMELVEKLKDARASKGIENNKTEKVVDDTLRLGIMNHFRNNLKYMIEKFEA